MLLVWVVGLVAPRRARDEPGRRYQQDPGHRLRAAVDLLQDRFPDQAGDTITVVVQSDDGATSAEVRGVVDPLLATYADLPHVVGRVAVGRQRPAAVSSDGTIGYATLDVTGARFPGEEGAA